MNATNNIGIIILAAGASTRLGKPKQLLKFQDKTLISQAVNTAINSKCSDIIVVLGSKSESITKEIKNFPIQICINKNWQRGMASSIKCGLEELIKPSKKTEAVIIMLCDQPFIESKHINLLVEKYIQSSKKIVASEYKNTVGVPTLFSSEIFDDLLKLNGDKGARKIIAKRSELVQKVKISTAEIDIDTPEDVKKLNELFKSE